MRLRGTVISGRVVDENGEPVRGAHVRDAELQPYVVASDADGYFRFAILPDTKIDLQATVHVWGPKPRKRKGIATGVTELSRDLIIRLGK